jgi:hypothetical protein
METSLPARHPSVVRSGPNHCYGACPLCRVEGPLRDSHFIPAALYPKNRRWTVTTRTRVVSDAIEVKEYLLCAACEGRFNRNGESEVLRWVAPKLKAGRPFPLLGAILSSPGQQLAPGVADVRVHSAAAFGVDTEAFAYFAVSVIWRAAIHEWTLPDGSKSRPLQLGAAMEPIRLFLLGQAAFPDAVVTVAVCTDAVSRRHWLAPMVNVDYSCGSFPFMTMGVMFRVWIGPGVPAHIRRLSCLREPDRPILATHCDDQTIRVLDGLAPFPDEE